MGTNRLALALSVAFALVACYAPSLPNGKQQCGPNGACPSGYQCGADNHCYKQGQLPTGDASAVADMAMACTATSCKGGPKPLCDTGSGACVECLMDVDCPSGKLCTNKACVPGCSATHGCPDGGGMCNTGSKMCMVCMKDADCGGNTPRCDTGTGNCVECLPTNDNCGQGKFCGQVNMVYTCQTGCQTVADCPKSDGGGMAACCNHICVDTDVDGKNCGMCGNDCGNKSCCGGGCSDVTMDVNNCGLCGTACAGKGASWTCVTSMCRITSCMQGFGDCNGSATDGCEAQLATDVNNCGMCNMKCAVTNGVGACMNSTCGIAMCNPGFGNCDNIVMNGCETNTGGDPNNCGMCGMKCTYANGVGACVASTCALAMCNNGFSNCDNNLANGCEAATASDPNNCGACNMKCQGANAQETCSASKCVITSCTNGFKDCDMMPGNGCETTTSNDPNNCGACNMKCAGANVMTNGCANSACTIVSCNAGFANCNGVVADGCEINTTNDKNNCSTCGMVCPNGKSCVNSVCQGMTEVKIGNFTPFGSTQPWTTGYLVAGVPVTIPANPPSTLLRLGIYSSGGAAQGQVILSLYTDSGGPQTLVTQSPAANLVVGSTEIPVANQVLAPGTYWVAFDVSVTGAGPGMDTNDAFTVYYDPIAFGAADPVTFARTAYATNHYNLWVVVGQ
jgi:hypothetical protein